MYSRERKGRLQQGAGMAHWLPQGSFPAVGAAGTLRQDGAVPPPNLNADAGVDRALARARVVALQEQKQCDTS